DDPLPFLIGEVGKDSTLVLHFSVSTDDAAFLAYADSLKSAQPGVRPRADRVDPKLVVSAYFNRRPAPVPTVVPVGHNGAPPPPPAPAVPRPVPDSLRVIPVEMAPCGTMEMYKGFVALDLGNTSSALVCMASDADGVAGIEVIGGADPRDNDPVETAVRIQQY